MKIFLTLLYGAFILALGMLAGFILFSEWGIIITLFVMLLYSFVKYYDKIRLLWVAIPMAQAHGAKLHYHEDLHGWIVLDQKDNHLWTSAYWTKLGAAIAYLKQHNLK